MSREFKAHKIFAACGGHCGRRRVCESGSEDFASCFSNMVLRPGCKFRVEARAAVGRVNFMVKLLRAHGGCLGRSRRRRTWQAAISLGEPQAGFDPGISEWGNPRGQTPRTA